MTALAMTLVMLAGWPFGSMQGERATEYGDRSFEVVFLVGYGQSSFAEEFLGESDQEMCIPVGLQLLYRPAGRLHAGLEFGTTARKFQWDELAEIGINVSVSQTMFGLMTRYMLPVMPSLSSYVRGGAGLYTGSHEATLGGLVISRPFNDTFGYNLGAGITVVDSRVCLGAEFIYHFVRHRYDDQPDQEPWDFSNWSVSLTASTPF